jgi:hypothetical protein
MARRIERVDEAIKQELAGVIERELKTRVSPMRSSALQMSKQRVT